MRKKVGAHSEVGFVSRNETDLAAQLPWHFS
jgi:hypothetical protein